jgi:hypothetical protein
MLTHHDRTVKNAIELFEENKDLPIEYWGFKDVGLEEPKMRQLVQLMKNAGKKTCIEIVSYTEEECFNGARLAVECGFDYLMGTLYYKNVHEFLKKQNIIYFPFCGTVSGSPSILAGSFDAIIKDAEAMIAKGIKGFDLLAYRHAQGEELAEVFCKRIPVPVVIAGSINSIARLEKMSSINPWGFTMGSALFDKDFDPNGTFRNNLEVVLENMKKLK